MNNKTIPLMVVAALASPTFAIAQSSLTISGVLKASFDQFNIGYVNYCCNRTGNLSETRVSDHASRVIFNVVEDLGWGLKALGQFDLRFNLDAQTRIGADYTSSTTTATMSPAINPISSGNNHVGLAGNWGAVKFGRQDIYYLDSGSVLPASTHIAATNQPIFHSLASANAGPTPNLVWYESPRISGIKTALAYSTNPLATSGTNQAENDLGTANRKGGGTYAKIDANIGDASLLYSYLSLKSDYTGGTMSVTGDSTSTTQNINSNQRGSTLAATYNFGNGLRAGIGTSSERATTVSTGSTIRANSKMISAAYTAGLHTIGYEGVKVSDQAINGSMNSVGAKANTFAYDYALSKRTNFGITYYTLINGNSGTFAPFKQGNDNYGGQFVSARGEKYTITGLVLRHLF